MIKFEHTEVFGWEASTRGLRNPLNSWDKSDSSFKKDYLLNNQLTEITVPRLYIGKNDLNLMQRLRKAGTDHRKYLRMIVVYVDITAPLYWWKEFDTYKVGTVANSCSTMHKIHAKEFTLDDFSCEHLTDAFSIDNASNPLNAMEHTIFCLNFYRNLYLKEKDKRYWWQMIQLLPSSYNQKRTVMLNYEVLNNIYKSRKNHKLDEWSENIIKVDGVEFTNKWLNDEMYVGFCDWIKTLPYAEELITGGKNI